MKSLLVTLVAVVSLCLPSGVHAQAGRNAMPQASVVAPVDTGGIDAYSDTTSIDTAAGANMVGQRSSHSRSYRYDFSLDDVSDPFGLVAVLTAMGFGGVVVAVLVVLFLLLVVLSPFILVAVILYLVFKRNNRRYKLIEKSIETGQPLPDDVRASLLDSKEVLWRKGVKNIFIGLGIAVLFFTLDIDELTGVGLFVALYGAGQAVIARTSARKDEGDKDAE